MKKLERYFLAVFFATFLVFCGVQGYFLFYPAAGEMARAKRLDAQLATEENTSVAVNREEEGLFVFLSFGTAKGNASNCSLMVNDRIIGDFSGGILSTKAYPGDEIYLIGGKASDEIILTDYPENLQAENFPPSMLAGGGEKLWGKVELK